MEDNLTELLESFGYPVFRQGSLAENEPYPSTFFTFWNNGEWTASSYDNRTKFVSHDFDVNVYADDPTKVYELLRQACTLLKNNGYGIPDRGHDLASDVQTHTGRGMNVTYLQRIKESEV
jgi:hypothetical protein